MFQQAEARNKRVVNLSIFDKRAVDLIHMALPIQNETDELKESSRAEQD
jgi:hypothetical protein